MLNLIYSGALTSLFIGLALLIQYEHNHRINPISRAIVILSSIAYGISFLLFSEAITHKATVFLRDVTLLFCLLIIFRVIRNSKILFPLLFASLVFAMSSFGFNQLHDSFKISKFSILKGGSASTEKPAHKGLKAKKKSKMAQKASKN